MAEDKKKFTHGGARENAGRKKSDCRRKQRSCNLSDKENRIYTENGGVKTLRALLNAGLFKAPKDD